MLKPPSHWLYRPLLIWTVGVILCVAVARILPLILDVPGFLKTTGFLLRIGAIWTMVISFDAARKAHGYDQVLLPWKRIVFLSTSDEPEILESVAEIELVALPWLLAGLFLSSIRASPSFVGVVVGAAFYLPLLTGLVVWGLRVKK